MHYGHTICGAEAKREGKYAEILFILDERIECRQFDDGRRQGTAHPQAQKYSAN